MRILWSANALWATTGYGIQGRSLLPRLQALGHQVANFAWYGLAGGMMQVGEIPIYPAAYEPFGVDIIGAHVKHFEADVVISLQDIWALPVDYGERVRPAKWVCWFPIDAQPCPPAVVERAKVADYPVTYSQFGLREAQAAGLSNVRYIPHGLELSVFKPGDKQAARRALGLDPNAFVCSMVAANKGYPARKCFAENLQAFAAFRRRHTGACLYLHTLASTATHGLDLRKLCAACGIPREAVHFADQYSYVVGMPAENVARVYQASDVLLAASACEGFGIPIVEAQACGTPVVTTNFSSMPELTCNGIATTPAQLSWTPLDSWVAVPSVGAIRLALEEISSRTQAEQQLAAEKGIAMVRERYDWDVCAQTYWRPFLEEIEGAIR